MRKSNRVMTRKLAETMVMMYDDLRYTYDHISRLLGVPLSTVRYTVKKLTTGGFKQE